ncbi:MAG TPA: ATP-binding protein, partial [Thermoanaerobaculia bacterium]|nr:ATP-binding protein [Thermoanaerobaculia bacterium]
LLSDTWSALTGYSAEEIPTVGDWLERAFGDRAAAMRDAVAALFDAPGPVQQEDVVVRTRSGEERIWSFSSAPLGRLEDGRRLVISKAHDVTERRRAQTVIGELHDALQEKLREVEASNLELEAFSYSVSHDLRAPLRAIDGFCRLLEEDCADQLPVEGRRYLDVVRDNARRMGQLIDDLLAFSRLGRKPLEPREVAMEALVRGAYAELRQEDDGREVALEVGDLPPCHGDPALLGQVVLNLLANALKFSRDRRPARIEVGWQPSEGGGAYFVRDNGVGFDMRYADKLFGVFQRLHRDDEFAGTGVGLALVQRIVHRHGGRIWASAEPGLGATFYFTLGGESEP